MQNIKQLSINLLKSFGTILFTSFIYVIINSIVKTDNISYLLTYIFIIIFLTIIYRNTLVSDFKSIKKDLKGRIKNITIFSIISIILMYIVNYILYRITNNIAANELSARTLLLQSPIIMSINIALLAPIVEEFTYRLPYKSNDKQKLSTFIVYSSIFALAHMQTTTNILDLLFFIPYLLLSICFGYGFYKTNNIYVSMIIHIINNLINIMLLLL